MGTPNQKVYASISKLLFDARYDDNRRLENFIGARVEEGIIESLHIDAFKAIHCNVRRRHALTGEEAILQISIKKAVEEIRNLERQRLNAFLEKYQRQKCNTTMREQRARYVGLPGPAPAGADIGSAPAGTDIGPAPAGTDIGPAPAGTNICPAPTQSRPSWFARLAGR